MDRSASLARRDAGFGEMISAIARYQAWYYWFAFEQRAVDVPM